MLKVNQTKIISLLLTAVLICVLSVTLYVVRQNKQIVKPSTRAIFANSTSTNPTYTDLQGNKLSLDDWLGQPIVVVSWASWSPFSATNLKILNDLATEYSGKNIKFLVINRKESNEQARRYLQTLENFPNLTIVIDTEDRFYSATGGYAMPETIIFNAKGDIILHEHGNVSTDLIREVIASQFENND